MNVLPMLAQVVEGSGPVALLIGLALGALILVVSFVVVRKITDQGGPPKRLEGEADAGKALPAPPKVDVLADRREVDAPVEVTEGMSLKEIKEARRARLSKEFKSSEAALAERERRRRGGADDALPTATAAAAESPSAPAGSEAESGMPTPAAQSGSGDLDVVSDPVPEGATVPMRAAQPATEGAPSSAPGALRALLEEEEDDDWALDDEPAVRPAVVASAPIGDARAVSSTREKLRGEPGAAESEPPTSEPAVQAAEDSASPALPTPDPAPHGAEDSAPVELPTPAPAAAAPLPSSATEAEVPTPASVDRSAAGDAVRVPLSVGGEPSVSVDLAPVTSLRDGLGKTRGGFIARLGSIFQGKGKLTPEQIEEIEMVLLTADVGARTAQRLLDLVQERVAAGEDSGAIWSILREETESILAASERAFSVGGERPFVVMVVGVNGVGKTTTIGKLAAKLQAEGHRVLVVAGDTFRAAAVGQLEEWSKRVGCGFWGAEEGANPSGVLFEGVRQAAAGGYDVVICDTAGRLHTKTPLIDELRKMHKSVAKAVEGAPHECVLVLDANTGQNAIQQARQFREAAPLTGVVLTKLDGTAKGGVIIGVSDELKIPVYFIGIGEAVGDLRAFAASEFVDALF